MMIIENGANYRESILNLLESEKLLVSDLPGKLDNFLVALQNGQVVGVVGLEVCGQYGLLRSVAVSAGFRSKGIAATLLTQLEDLASLKAISHLYLITETASKYFTRKGYKAIPRTDVPALIQQSLQFSELCPQSAIVMKKSI